MADEETPVAYTALSKGVPMFSAGGNKFGTVEHVLQIPEEDIFDGIVAHTHKGLRFVDSNRVETITTARVSTTLSDEEAANLPEPAAPATFRADSLDDSGESLHDRFGRMFGRAHWSQTTD